MRTLITIAALVASVSAIAQTQVPNVFEDGTPASAAEVNANFDALSNSISNLDERVTVLSGAGCEQATYEYLGQTEKAYKFPHRIEGLNACRAEFGDSADIANSAVMFAQYVNRAELAVGWAVGEWGVKTGDTYFGVPTGPGKAQIFIAIYPTVVAQVKEISIGQSCSSSSYTCSSNPYHCMKRVD